MAQNWGLWGKVVLTGWRWDIPEIMASIDIFALTSLWEGLPRVFAEAVATGTPIVTTEVGGARERIADGINGYLVSPSSNGDMAQRIISLLNNQQKFRQLAVAGGTLGQEV